jgi:hypothetical protein
MAEKENLNANCMNPLMSMILVVLLELGGMYVIGSQLKPTQTTYISPTPLTHQIDGSGEASKYVKPDQVLISLSVVTEEKTAKDSQTKNAEQFDKMKTALLGAGLVEDELKTTSYTVDKVTKPIYVCPIKDVSCTKEEMVWDYEVTGYRTTNSLQIKTSKMDKAGALIDTAVANGANDVNGISFTLKDETRKQVEQELLDKAVKDAKSQATIMANAAGITLGKPMSINRNSYYYPGYDESYKSIGMANAETSTVPTSVMAGDIKVTVSVYASFEIQ